MNRINRRQLLKHAGLGAGLTMGGLTLFPRLARASGNDQVLLTIFLRGGADGMSWLHPTASATPSVSRLRYESWRQSQTRITNGIPVNGRLSMHPALAPLQPAMNAGHAMLIGGVAGAQPNRSHFEQQDLIETGAGPTGAPQSDGLLGRALLELGRQDAVLSGVALNSTPPELLRRGATGALSITDFRSLGKLSSSTHDHATNLALKDRLNRLYVPFSGLCKPAAKICNSGGRAEAAIRDVEQLRSSAGISDPTPVGSLGALLDDLAALLAVDTNCLFKCINLDLGGWDTHLEQGNDAQSGGAFTGALAKNLHGLAQALAGFYNAAQSSWSRLTILVVTEFGRTTRQNGTTGTDHGYGSTALLMGSNLMGKVKSQGYFPNNNNASFYAEAESTNALPQLIDHRQLFWEVLSKRLQVPNLGAVLPGFSPDSSAPTLLV